MVVDPWLNHHLMLLEIPPTVRGGAFRAELADLLRRHGVRQVRAGPAPETLPELVQERIGWMISDKEILERKRQ